MDQIEKYNIVIIITSITCCLIYTSVRVCARYRLQYLNSIESSHLSDDSISSISLSEPNLSQLEDSISSISLSEPNLSQLEDSISLSEPNLGQSEDSDSVIFGVEDIYHQEYYEDIV